MLETAQSDANVHNKVSENVNNDDNMQPMGSDTNRILNQPLVSTNRNQEIPAKEEYDTCQ